MSEAGTYLDVKLLQRRVAAERERQVHGSCVCYLVGLQHPPTHTRSTQRYVSRVSKQAREQRTPMLSLRSEQLPSRLSDRARALVSDSRLSCTQL